MTKLVELQATFKIIKKDYKNCKKTVSELHQVLIRLNNDVEDINKEILKAENHIKSGTSEEIIFQLLVYKPKVITKMKDQAVVRKSNYVDYLPFENDVLVKNTNHCTKFIELANRELIIWEAVKSQFKKEYDFSLVELKKKSKQYYSLIDKIANKIELINSKSNIPKKKKVVSEYRKLYKVYLECCTMYPSERPTVRKLESLTKDFCSRSKWNRLFLEFDFCTGLIKEVNKKIHYHYKSKEKQDFWIKKLQDLRDYEYSKACENFAKKHKELKSDTKYADSQNDE